MLCLTGSFFMSKNGGLLAENSCGMLRLGSSKAPVGKRISMSACMRVCGPRVVWPMDLKDVWRISRSPGAMLNWRKWLVMSVFVNTFVLYVMGVVIVRTGRQCCLVGINCCCVLIAGVRVLLGRIGAHGSVAMCNCSIGGFLGGY